MHFKLLIFCVTFLNSHVGSAENRGAFHSTKNSDLKFRKFHVANGTVNREIFRMVIPARVDRAVPFSFGQKFPEIYDREVLQTEIFSNGTVISDQNGPTEKAVHLERWTFFSQNWLDRTFPSVSGWNFRKFWLNGKRPRKALVSGDRMFLYWEELV